MKTEPSPGSIALAAPRFGPDALEELASTLRSGRLSDGPRVARFEREIAEYCGVPFGIATTSATTALELTLAALDVGRADEVIVPDFTYPATANAVIQRGATVRLVDIEPSTFCIAPAAMEDALSERTAAVVAVDLFGLPADYGHIERVLADRGIPLICDAACALGSEYEGRRCGSIGTAACLSFHPRKLLTTGEGGMVLTADADLAERMRRLRNHGSVRHGWRSEFIEPGFNFRMSELQAAVGIAQTGKIEAVVRRRNELARMLSELISTIEGITPQAVPTGCRHAYQAYVAMLDEKIERDQVIASLRETGIESTLGTYGLHAETAYRERCGTRPGDLPNSWQAANQTITLPLHEHLRPSDVERIAERLAVEIASARC